MRPGHRVLVWIVVLVVATTAWSAPAAAQPGVQGQWALVQPLPYSTVHTHLLPSGQVMFWGLPGVPGDEPQSWDPATGSVAPVSTPGYEVFCTGHAFLADGRLFLAGGHIDNNVGLPRASTYDSATNAWSALPNMNAGRWYPTATVLGNGDVLVVAGDIDTTVGGNPLPQVFQLSSSTWRDLTNAQLAMDLYPRMLLAPNGRVFNPAPSVITRYLDTSGSGQWIFVANRVGGYRDYGSAVMYAPGKILVMGGGDPPTNTAEVIDLNQPTPSWRAVASMQ